MDLYLVPVGGGTERRITMDAAIDRHADWSPQGKLLAFHSGRGGSLDIWLVKIPDPAGATGGEGAEPSLAAVLALIGYSLNDSIVVADRIRDEFRNTRETDPEAIINGAVNQTLTRTINTSLTTLLVLVALFFFGGEVMKAFSEALIVGVLVGTYSSIYVVTNILFMMKVTKEDFLIPEPEELDETP